MINIFFSSDDNYAQHTGVCIKSILENTKSSVSFFILDGGISDKNKEKLKSLTSHLQIIKINKDEFEDFPSAKFCPHISLPAYFRLKIADIRPDLDKVIYLDCDTIVKENIRKLWDIKLEKLMAIVEESTFEHTKKAAQKRCNTTKYFNSGVLLINLEKWRRINATEQCLDYIKKNKDEIVFMDQDILNTLFKNDIEFIHPKWNLQTSVLKGGKYELYPEEEIKEAKQTPAIIHYNTHSKPWYTKENHELEKEYFKYLKKTPWKNFIFKYKFLRLKYILRKTLKRLI